MSLNGIDMLLLTSFNNFVGMLQGPEDLEVSRALIIFIISLGFVGDILNGRRTRDLR